MSKYRNKSLISKSFYYLKLFFVLLFAQIIHPFHMWINEFLEKAILLFPIWYTNLPCTSVFLTICVDLSCSFFVALHNVSFVSPSVPLQPLNKLHHTLWDLGQPVSCKAVLWSLPLPERKIFLAIWQQWYQRNMSLSKGREIRTGPVISASSH